MKLKKIILFILLFSTKLVQANELVGGATEDPDASSKDSGCAPLAPGASVEVNDNYQNSPTGVDRHYKMTRNKKNPNVYEIELPIRFSASFDAIKESQGSSAEILSPNDRDYGVKANAMTVANFNAKAHGRLQMSEHVKKCFRSMDGKVKAADGTEFRFSLADKRPNNEIKAVKVESEAFRSHSEAWSRNADCATIIHESLHWLGLVDGYKEQDPEHGSECRSLEPDDSAMANPDESLVDHYDTKFCKPVEGEEKRIVFANSVAEAKCPGRKVAGGPFIDIPDNSLHPGHLKFFSKNPSTMPGSLIIVRGSGKTRASLYPAHVRMITQPNCGSKNSKYVTCAKNAYRRKGDCAPTPGYCSSGDYLE